MSAVLEELFVCPQSDCVGPLVPMPDGLTCTRCQRTYPISDGIPVLLPDYEDEVRRRYLENYERIARDDLEEPFEATRAYRHRVLRSFIGNVRGKRVLDIGSSQGLYLQQLDARLRVAFDIAMPYLRLLPEQDGLVRVCGDAESLPFSAGAFDVIVIADVLEHVLEPEQIVRRLAEICTPETRLIVHVPWRENLEGYRSLGYEFTHLRSFNNHTFGWLFRDFEIVRRRDHYPKMDEPLLFRLGDRLPLSLYNRWARAFFADAAGQEREQRVRRRRELALPRLEWLWRRIYAPVFRIFELSLARPQAAQ